MRRRAFLRGVLGIIASIYMPAQLVDRFVGDRTMLPTDPTRTGWVIYEKIGTCMVNKTGLKKRYFALERIGDRSLSGKASLT